MSGAIYILTANAAVAVVISAAFLTISAFDRTQASGRWLAASYLIGVLYCLSELAIHFFGGDRLLVAVSTGALLLAMGAFNIGLSRKYQAKAPVRTSLAILVAGVAVTFLVFELPRHSLMRMMAFQLPYAAMQAVAALLVMRARDKRWTDWLLGTVLALSSAQFLTKPLIAQISGGWGANPASYLDSIYAMVSQSMGTVFTVAVALLTMVVLVVDVLTDATTKSETDTLSGLHNRRGFDRHGEEAVRRARESGLPVSLVTVDLDRFKAINDSYGHAAGDRVLAAFASFLRQATSKLHIAGRIGGEEFAIVLPGVNLAGARLFAEGARIAFAAMRVEGLPEEQQFTASFGVAELLPGERLESLLNRADLALYAAKRAGRDCVKIAEGGDAIRAGHSIASA